MADMFIAHPIVFDASSGEAVSRSATEGFLALYGTHILIAVFTIARQWTLSLDFMTVIRFWVCPY
jgi:hypothetical protein